MKLNTLILLILLSLNLHASPGVNCEFMANNSQDQVGELVKCLGDPESYEPSRDLKWKCEQCKDTGDGDFCVDEKLQEEIQAKNPRRDMMHAGKMDHCSGNKNTLCFDGKPIKLNSKNKSMMEVLCTNVPVRVSEKKSPQIFGACEIEDNLSPEAKGLRVSGKVSCYCQGPKGKSSWKCYDNSKK